MKELNSPTPGGVENRRSRSGVLSLKIRAQLLLIVILRSVKHRDTPGIPKYRFRAVGSSSNSKKVGISFILKWVILCVKISVQQNLKNTKDIEKKNLDLLNKKKMTDVIDEESLFVDNDFPHPKDPEYWKTPTVWVRPHQISVYRKVARKRIMPPDVKPVMWNEEPSTKDINQGNVGDCWFLGSLPLMFKSIKDFSKIFGFSEEDGYFGVQNTFTDQFDAGIPYDGKFTFQFWSHDKWVKVEIDDRLPCNEKFHYDGSKYYTLKAAKVSDDSSELAVDDTVCEYWVPLLEKAYAKFKGGYAAIESGNSYEAYADLMGAVGEKLDIRKMIQKFGWVSAVSADDQLSDSECSKVFSKLIQLDELGALMTVSVDSNKYNGSLGPIEDGWINGVGTGHCYNLLGFYHAFGDNLLVKLYNPHGGTEYKSSQAKFSDNDPIWKENPEETERLQNNLEDDGEFFMTIQDALKLFTDINVSYRRKLFMDEDELKKSPSYFETFKEKHIQMKQGESNRSIARITYTKGGVTIPKQYMKETTMDFMEFEIDDALLESQNNNVHMLISYDIKNRRQHKNAGDHFYTKFQIKKFDEENELNLPFPWYHVNTADMNYVNTNQFEHISFTEPGKYRVYPMTFYPLKMDIEGYCTAWIKKEKEIEGTKVDPAQKKRDALNLKLKLKRDELNELQQEIDEIKNQIGNL